MGSAQAGSRCELCQKQTEEHPSQVIHVRTAGTEQSEAEVLSEYFLGPYHFGHDFVGSEYACSADLEVGGALVLEHERTGVRVWAFALDLRESDDPGDGTVLYHYTKPSGLASICRRPVRHGSELLASLEDGCSHFGKGIYATSRGPGSFQSKEEVLINNCWPRCGDPAAPEDHEANELKRGGGIGSGPDDPQNAGVLRAILQNPERRESAKYCVPIIVEASKVADIWRGLPPDLVAEGIPPGCNRWREPQWPGRDIQVIGTTSALLGASAERMLKVAKARAQHSEKLLGFEHRRALLAAGEWAACLSQLGRHAEAEALRRRCYGERHRSQGAEHPETLFAMGKWASSLLQLGRLAEAETLLGQCYDASGRSLGEDHPQTLLAMGKWAGSLLQLGRHAEAETLLSRCYDSSSRSLGEDHPKTLAALRGWAASLSELGRHDEAEPLHKQCYDAVCRTLGADHPTALLALRKWVASLREQGRDAEATALERQCYDACRRTLGDDHPQTLTALCKWAGSLEDLGHNVKAEPLRKQCYDAFRRTLGADHPKTIVALREWVDCLYMLGRDAEAEALEKRCSDTGTRTFAIERTASLTSLGSWEV